MPGDSLGLLKLKQRDSALGSVQNVGKKLFRMFTEVHIYIHGVYAMNINTGSFIMAVYRSIILMEMHFLLN